MVKLFTLDRVQSSPAKMDLQKLLWMNGEYMKRLPPQEFGAKCRELLQAGGVVLDGVAADYFDRVLALMRDRIKQWDHVVPMTNYFFLDEYSYDEKSVEKRLKKEGALAGLKSIRDLFAALDEFNAETTDKALHELATEKGVNAGELVHPIRVAVSGSAAGPSLFHMLEVMGKERVLRRIDRTLQLFGG